MNPNKQIFIIKDGKPTCIKKGKRKGLLRRVATSTSTLTFPGRRSLGAVGNLNLKLNLDLNLSSPTATT